MPLYEYRCSQCGHRFEKIQSFSAPETAACPKCEGTSERLLSAPAIQFKGSGFYLTDYGKAGGKKGEGASGGEAKTGTDTKSSGDGGKSTPAAAPSSGSTSSSTPSGTSGSSSTPSSS